MKLTLDTATIQNDIITWTFEKQKFTMNLIYNANSPILFSKIERINEPFNIIMSTNKEKIFVGDYFMDTDTLSLSFNDLGKIPITTFETLEIDLIPVTEPVPEPVPEPTPEPVA